MNALIKAARCVGIMGVLLHSFAAPVYAAEQQRPPRDEHHFGPSEEAQLACKGLSDNDVCTFAGHNDELLNGQCSTPPHSTDKISLACTPDNIAAQHDAEPPENRQD